VTIALRDAITDAALTASVIHGRTIAAPTAKAVLWTLYSLADRGHVSGRAIAERAGCCQTTAYLAIAALERDGLIRKTAARRARQRYEIVVARLRALAAVEPLSSPARGPRRGA